MPRHLPSRVEERPNASWIYRNLASTLSGSGRIDEAKLAFAEMLRSYPDLTISKYKQAMVFSQALGLLDRWRRISESWACLTKTMTGALGDQ